MWEPTLPQLFDDGAEYQWPDGKRARLGLITAADVVLPSGRLVVCDPDSINWPGVSRIAAEVAPGRYPVQLSILSWAGMRRCTAARVLLSSSPVETWTPAWPGPKGPEGFGVDGGQGCFVDETVAERLGPIFDDDDRAMEVVETVLDQQWDVVGDPESGNAVVFACGMGDGVYAVWLGRSEDGAVVQVAADLELLAHSERPAPA